MPFAVLASGGIPVFQVLVVDNFNETEALPFIHFIFFFKGK